LVPVAGWPVFDFVKDPMSSQGITWPGSFEPEVSGTKLTFEGRPRSFWRVPPLKQLVEWSMVKGGNPVMSKLEAYGGIFLVLPLAPRTLVGVTGFEPAASSSRTWSRDVANTR
jgi:hypothetical protein